MTITIVSLLSQVLYIDLPTHADYVFFTKMLESNAERKILPIQIANEEFKSRLQMLDELCKTNKKYLMMKAAFDGIPKGSKFVVVAGKIDDAMLLLRLKQEVDKLNNLADTPSDLDNTRHRIISLYYTQMFNGNTKRRHYVGEVYKSNRICRFCGNRFPTVSFNNTSHAISESLGNKSIICREECDNCNERFSRTIEPDIANMLSFLLTIYSIHGKNGIRTTTGKNFKLSVDDSVNNKTNNEAIKLELDKELSNNPEKLFKEPLSLDASSLKYTPQNCYKCLCKYVVSVIKEKYLPDFKNTINWVNSTTRYCKLPLVAIGNARAITDAPYLIVSIRKTNNYNYPYCFALFVIANTAFAFIVPFTSKDRYKFTTSSKYAVFQEMIRLWYGGFKWEFSKLSSSRETYTQVDFNLHIPPGCKLGEDYFIEQHSNIMEH